MENDKKVPDEYPKLSENDKRWKQQDEFDSAGAQLQQEDEDANASITESTEKAANDNTEKDTHSVKEGESSRRDREQP